MREYDKSDNKRKKLFLVILIVVLCCIFVALIYIVWHLYNDATAGSEYEGIISSSEEISAESDVYDNTAPSEVFKSTGEIDFEELWKINPDLYAWIRIPNTMIDYPVAQADSETDDSFYLDHNMYKEYAFAGCIYTEKMNSKTFTDPNTVLYGHDMANGSMFRHLYYFREEDFFENNKYIYVYLPDRTLTYEIFSAYEYDDRHIMNSFDFSDKEVFEEYINYAKNPNRAVISNTRDIPVTVDDRIITLSTCFGSVDTSRYLVQGVLINDE